MFLNLIQIIGIKLTFHEDTYELVLVWVFGKQMISSILFPEFSIVATTFDDLMLVLGIDAKGRNIF